MPADSGVPLKQASSDGREVSRLPCILYVGASLPSRSETFVYREVFALRGLGFNVRVASIHQPQRGLGEARLDQLADEAISVYHGGFLRLIVDAAAESISHPIRKVSTTLMAIGDAVAGRDITLVSRPKIIIQLLAGLALARRVRRHGVDHIHAHMAHVPATIAMYAAKQLGVPFSFTGHAADIFRSRTLLTAKLERASFAACISHWHREYYRGIVALPDDRLPIVRCGVDPGEFAPRDAGARSVAAGDPLRVLAVGRLVPKKGFDLLLRAMSRLHERGQRLCATIVGDGPERAELVRLCAELQLQRYVEFTGAMSNRQVRDRLGDADLFVLPCRIDPTGDRDGIPVVLMEAMASGVCCLSGNLPAIGELIVDGVNGRLVTPGDVDSLVAALHELVSGPERRSQLAAAGRASIEREFTMALNARRMARALTSSIAGREASPRFQAAPPDHPSSPPIAAAKRSSPIESPLAMHDPHTMPRRYVLITPCRDEAPYMQRTIDTVAAQTIPPVSWIIVDDGSTDDTPRIAAAAAARNESITVIRRENRGQRAVGPGVVEAFYAGLATIDLDDFDYLCKLDADLELPPHYFQRLIECFESDPCLGTLSGKLYLRYGNTLVEERCGDENSVGPAKFYRTECFRDIGGFVRQVSWDGIDGHMCRMRGWIARSMHDDDLKIVHLRRMGSSQNGFWTGRLRWGRGKYFMGSAWYYVLAVSIYRMFERPWILSGIGIFCGYLQAMVQRLPRFDHPDYIRFLRRYELMSLICGKRRTMRAYHDRIHAARSSADSKDPKRRDDHAPAELKPVASPGGRR